MVAPTPSHDAADQLTMLPLGTLPPPSRPHHVFPGGTTSFPAAPRPSWCLWKASDNAGRSQNIQDVYHGSRDSPTIQGFSNNPGQSPTILTSLQHFWPVSNVFRELKYCGHHNNLYLTPQKSAQFVFYCRIMSRRGHHYKNKWP